MKRLYALACLTIPLAVLSYAQAPEIFTGKVVSIADGDTIGVMRDGAAVKVRLHGIDCPEEGQPFSQVAKQFTSEQCFDKTVTVQVTDVDKYGRTVGIVTLPNRKKLNNELVSNGLAWWYKEYAPNDSTLASAQTRAMTNQLGLWTDPHAIAPWDWRKGLREHAPPAELLVPEYEGQEKSVTLNPDGSKTLRMKGDGEYSPPATTQPLPSYQPQQSTSTYVAPNSASSTSEGTVYVTRTGEKYHRAGCRYLSKSQIPIDLSDAKAQGYGPCSVCRP